MLDERSSPERGALAGVALDRMLGVLGYAVGEDETFRERVKRLRDRTGMSQIAFADAAHLSREGYQKIERGITAKPDNDTVRAIAKAAKQRVSVLSRMLDWLPIEEAEDPLADLTDDQRELVFQLIDMLKKTSPPQKASARPHRAVHS